jgi:dTDP-glucose 4,6-dehydratase
MKNLLVTGGAGFIGANFIRYLLEESGYEGRVINVDKLSYAGNLENLSGIPENFGDRYNFIQADITDGEALEKIFSEGEIDAICHFAAESHVDRSILAPETFIQTNVVGTFRLLELARKYGDQLELFHHVSTDEVYGSLGAKGLFHEDTPYHPNSPYSASKAASDHLVRAYHHTYGIPVTLSNCSNNYGPYQFPEKLIPLMILNCLDENSLPIYGDGKNVRDWLYVKDHARAIWTIMQKGERGQTYNIGGRGEKNNLQVVRNICQMMDEFHPRGSGKSYGDLITFIPDRLGHDRRYAMDFSKLQEELGWQPEESFETGLEKTLRWYLKNLPWVRRVQSGEYRDWVQQQYGEKFLQSREG